VTDSDRDPSSTEAQDPLAEAEEELARAEERAEAARARAVELRREAESEPSEQQDAAEDAEESTEDDLTPARWRRSPRLPWRFRRPSSKAVGLSAALVIVCASLGASGYMVWQHRALEQRKQRAAEFTEAAREEVATLMSIDPAHAVESIQHTIDDSTGALKSQLEATSAYMAKNAQDAQVTTKATVQEVAVESMTDNTAVLLVVAKSDTTNADKTPRPPAFWRLSVNIERDGDRLKMSKLDFVQ
jgi:Mce-associated membrane protein